MYWRVLLLHCLFCSLVSGGFAQVEYEDARLNQILANVESLNAGMSAPDSNHTYTAVHLDHGGMGILYYERAQLKKVSVWKDINDEKSVTEYYMDGDVVMYVSEYIDYHSSKEREEDGENRYFFQNGSIIRIYMVGDCGAPFNDEFRNNEQQRLMDELESVLSEEN